MQAVSLVHIVEKSVHGGALRRRMLPEELRAHGRAVGPVGAIGAVCAVHHVRMMDACLVQILERMLSQGRRSEVITAIAGISTFSDAPHQHPRPPPCHSPRLMHGPHPRLQPASVKSRACPSAPSSILLPTPLASPYTSVIRYAAVLFR